MPIETTYTQARTHLAQYYDSVVDDQEVVIVNRRGKEPLAMISAAELSSLLETAYLLRSPKNAQRLLRALERSRANQGTRMTLEQLRKKVGVVKK
jgi:antitoxin YefM